MGSWGSYFLVVEKLVLLSEALLPCPHQHLQSKKHRDYATNDANFAALDSFAAEKGLDFATFLKTVREKSAAMADQDSSSSGNIVLITPPNSPAPPPATPHPCKASSETASPAKRCIPVEKYIMAGFSSPKRGSLCIMPIKLTGKGSSTGASLPGHAPVTPTKCPDGVGGGKRTRKDSVCCVGTPSGKRQRPQSTPPPADDFVPETPEKKVGLVGVTQRSPLCNMQALVHRKLVVDGGEDGGERGRTEAASPVKRRMRCLVKKVLNKVCVFSPMYWPVGYLVGLVLYVQELLDEITRDSSMNSSFTLSPGTSPLTGRARGGLRTEEGVAPSTPSCPLSLVISLPLKSPSPHTNTGHAPVTPTKCPDGVGGGKRARKDGIRERDRTEAAFPVKRRLRCLVKKVLDKVCVFSPMYWPVGYLVGLVLYVQELLDEITRDSSMNSSFTLSPGTSPLTRRRTEEGVAPSTLPRPSPWSYHYP